MRKLRRASRVQQIRKLQNACDMYRLTELVITLDDAKHLINAISEEMNSLEKIDDCILITFLLSDSKVESTQFPGIEIERAQVLVAVEKIENPDDSFAFLLENSDRKLRGFFDRIRDIFE